MNVGQLINLLSDMDPEADVCLGIDRDWGETELHILTIDDLVLANTYIAFQVPNNRRAYYLTTQELNINVAKLIELLSDMDPDADVALGIDSDWGETELHLLTVDDVALANTYVAFQVPNNRRNDNDR